MRRSPVNFGIVLICAIVTQVSVAQDRGWRRVQALPPGQEIRISLHAGKTCRGALQSASDDTITVGKGQVLNRDDVERVWMKRPGRRAVHALEGLGIGAGAGLGMGAAVDSQDRGGWFPNAGKEVFTPAFAVIGLGIGAVLPAHGWEEVYRSQ